MGDAQEGTRLTTAAYVDAPAIVAQRYEFEDGRPLADRPIDSLALECNRVENGRLDPSLQLQYFHLNTDAGGFVYLPAYKTVYRLNDMASPAGYDIVWPKLGWFETAQKVGILPAAVVTEKDGEFLPVAKADVPPTAEVTLADGTKVTIEAVTTCPVAGANGWWKVDGSPVEETIKPPAPGISSWPSEGGLCFLLRFSQALTGRDLAFEFSAPSTQKSHYTTVRTKDLGKPFFLYAVLPTEPERVSIRIGETGSEWKVAAEAKGGGEQGVFTFEEPKVANGKTAIRVKHEKLDGEVRLRAVDESGKEHAPVATLSGSESNSEGVTYEDGGDFDLPLEKIASFRLETRDYQWAEFGNIAVKPRK